MAKKTPKKGREAQKATIGKVSRKKGRFSVQSLGAKKGRIQVRSRKRKVQRAHTVRTPYQKRKKSSKVGRGKL